MGEAFPLAPLFATLVLRQYSERMLRAGAGETTTHPAGAASIIFWYCSYSVLLVLACLSLWGTPPGASEWLGYVILWAGITLRQLSLHQIGAYYHVLIVIRERHRLVDTGPYRFLRHPLHLGLHLEMLGLAILAGAALGWLVLAASLLVLVRRNRCEEKSMQDFFGVAYENYRRRSWDLVDLVPGRIA